MKRKKEVVGQLRDQLIIQSFAATFDTVGQEQITWSDEQTVWCSIKYRNSGDSEAFAGDVQTVFQVADFTIRYRASLNEKKRIRYDGKVYDILNLRPDDRKVYQIVSCQLRQ